MKKERILYLDFIRAISVFIIVIYHFNCTFVSSGVNGYNKFIYNFKNGSWGAIGVILFFIISGVGLSYSYGENIDIKKYYKKRFLKIYPMFWIGYTIIFLYNFYCNLGIPHLNKLKIILSIIGMDGYLLYLEPNFYIIGEWFLGAIILIYMLFPLLMYIIKKIPKTYLIILTILTILICLYNPFKISIGRNLIVCIFSFSLGIYFEKYIKDIKFMHFLIATIIAIATYFIDINISKDLITHIFAIALFIDFVYISKYIMKVSVIKEFCQYISKYSYAIFLLHHYILSIIISKFKGAYLSITETLCLLILNFFVIMFFSKILTDVTDKITKKMSKYKIEKFDIEKIKNKV